MEGILNSPYFQQIVAKIGYDKALRFFGLDKQEQNPKYAISLGGINLNPMNMLKRAGINQGIKSLMGGKMSSLMAPAALLGGAVMLGRAFDPTRQGSRNYNPNLSGQIDYLSKNNMIGIDQGGLTKYGPDSILSGLNVVSMFGTNDYLDQLNKYKNKYYDTMSQKNKDKIDKEIDNYNLDQVKKDLKEEERIRNRKNYVAPHHGSVHSSGGNNNGGGGNRDNAGGGAAANRGDAGSGWDSSPFRRGGIASL